MHKSAVLATLMSQVPLGKQFMDVLASSWKFPPFFARSIRLQNIQRYFMKQRNYFQYG